MSMYTLSLSFRLLSVTVGQLYSVASTLKMMKDPFPDLASDSESQEEAILYPNDNSTAPNGGTTSEAIPASLSNLGPEPPSKSFVVGSESDSVDEHSYSDWDDTSGDSDDSDSPRWSPKVCQSATTQ